MTDKLDRQGTDIEEKRENYLKELGCLRKDVSESQNNIVDKRIILAKYHNDNEKIGLKLKSSKSDVEKLEKEVIDLKNTLDNLHNLEKEKKEMIIVLHQSKKEIL